MNTANPETARYAHTSWKKMFFFRDPVFEEEISQYGEGNFLILRRNFA